MKIVVTDSINAKAKEIKECIDFISQKITEINISIGLVNTFWKGTDANSFDQKYDEAIIKLKEYQNSFETYYHYLLKIYDIFSSFEDSYNKKIDVS